MFLLCLTKFEIFTRKNQILFFISRVKKLIKSRFDTRCWSYGRGKARGRAWYRALFDMLVDAEFLRTQTSDMYTTFALAPKGVDFLRQCAKASGDVRRCAKASGGSRSFVF